MARTIEGVPESIDRQAFLDFLTSIGFDVKSVMSVEFAMTGVHAVVQYRDPSGRLVIGDNDQVITSLVFIPDAGPAEAAEPKTL